MTTFKPHEHPHRRFNPLLNEWILVSPQRAKRPWQGQTEFQTKHPVPEHDEDCYLCAGNTRANGEKNPHYLECFVFDNDFPALLQDEVQSDTNSISFFKAQPERGINRVVCFSPNHSLTLAEMEVHEIQNVIKTWQKEYIDLGSLSFINYVQLFENKGSIMGCSNPHPHGQIWAQQSLPSQVERTQGNLFQYWNNNGTNLLMDYLSDELQAQDRIIFQNDYFVVLVPYWAVWPFETMILPKKHHPSLATLTETELTSFAECIQQITVRYDNLFSTSFPYSAGIHQAPTDGDSHPEWQLHMHFYPPLLRSAQVKKFMVGYEMLGEPQRDMTPEQSAAMLRDCPNQHYKTRIV